MLETSKYDAQIILESGQFFFANYFGYKKITICELVFNTAVCGYQEALTDPSYFKQGLVFTFPLIGIYGINNKDNESNKIQASALIIENLENDFSNNHACESLNSFLLKNKVPGIHNIDTRYLTKIIRENGSLKAIIAPIEEDKNELLNLLQKSILNHHVEELNIEKHKTHEVYDRNKTLIVYDFGCKENILNYFKKENFHLYCVNHHTKYEEIKKIPHCGIFLSNGPGDPTELKAFIEQLKLMIDNGEKLIGICLGHQLISLALGLKIQKLKFGHHSINHPVINLKENKVLITSQNHNYVTSEENWNPQVEVTYRSVNDGTIEGIRHISKKIMSVQFHPEANPGPYEAEYVFNEFKELLNA